MTVDFMSRKFDTNYGTLQQTNAYMYFRSSAVEIYEILRRKLDFTEGADTSEVAFL